MIQLQNLVKDYGTLRAVDHINFEINDGEILGFLGPNGAGKTTTIRMITCFLSPTAGNISVGEINVLDNPIEIKKMIGYLPEHNPLYTEMTVHDYLKFAAEVRGVKNFKKRLKEVSDKCGLHGIIQKPINTLSKGYKQRVGLAHAMMGNPEILVLDEADRILTRVMIRRSSGPAYEAALDTKTQCLLLRGRPLDAMTVIQRRRISGETEAESQTRADLALLKRLFLENP